MIAKTQNQYLQGAIVGATPSTPLSPARSPLVAGGGITSLTPLGEVAGASGARSVVR